MFGCLNHRRYQPVKDENANGKGSTLGSSNENVCVEYVSQELSVKLGQKCRNEE